jgi:hypothetical protein
MTSYSIQISIPEPCAQAWDDMRPVQGGRHCTHCQKTVVDFTHMTDAQLIEYLRKHPYSCGRLRPEQLEIPLRQPPAQRYPWLKRIAATLLVLLALFGKAKAQSQDNKRDAVEQGAIASSPIPPVDNGEREIYGTLTDEKGNAVANADVYVVEDGITKSHTLTDFAGNYSVKPLMAGRYDVRFVAQGRTLTVTGVAINDHPTKVCGVLRSVVEPGASLTIGKITTSEKPIIEPEYPGGHKSHRFKMIPKGW